MLQYLNLHIVQEGKDFYIYDWATIKNKTNQWYCITDGSTKTVNPQTININGSFHSSDDTTITIADVYN